MTTKPKGKNEEEFITLKVLKEFLPGATAAAVVETGAEVAGEAAEEHIQNPFKRGAENQKERAGGVDSHGNETAQNQENEQ